MLQIVRGFVPGAIPIGCQFQKLPARMSKVAFISHTAGFRPGHSSAHCGVNLGPAASQMSSRRVFPLPEPDLAFSYGPWVSDSLVVIGEDGQRYGHGHPRRTVELKVWTL